MLLDNPGNHPPCQTREDASIPARGDGRQVADEDNHIFFP
jgi:hypothetical protein